MKLANVNVPSCFYGTGTFFAIKFIDKMLRTSTFCTETREKKAKKKLGMFVIVLFLARMI
jgi:hypothetical protein